LLGEAVIAYREALKIYTQEQTPERWATTQDNLGSALRAQGERTAAADGMRLLGEAVAAFQEALKVHTREQLPQQWAMTQNNLGVALSSQGERRAGADGARLLGEAVAAFREALKVYTREQTPQEWAGTQNNLGFILSSRGERIGGPNGSRLLDEAVTAFREALKVYTCEQAPQQWVATQDYLGFILSSQSERTEGYDRVRLLGEAVTAYREVLKVYTREQSPQKWKMTQNSLGNAYFRLENWKEAAICFENVLALDPAIKATYQNLASIYQERLFEYAKAFELHRRWLSQFSWDRSVLPDFAETHFTTGRFEEFSGRIKPLLIDPEIPAGAKAALQMIEVANLVALDQAPQIPAALDALIKVIAEQKDDFRIEWPFNGTVRFINQHEKFAARRAWLNSIFAAAQEEKRDAILKKLREAHTNFMPVEQ
jgi:tetratricopeptide (TPR) repeat protein